MEALQSMVAPEFQLMLSNGKGFDRDGYLNLLASEVDLAPDFKLTNITASLGGDFIVARYFAEVNESISRKKTARKAPRLTVFRNINGDWKLISHAVFGVGK